MRTAFTECTKFAEIFDTALDLSLSVGGSKEIFLDELKRNVFTPLQIHRLRK